MMSIEMSVRAPPRASQIAAPAAPTSSCAVQDASPSRRGERMTGSFPCRTASPEKCSVSPSCSMRSARGPSSPRPRLRAPFSAMTEAPSLSHTTCRLDTALASSRYGNRPICTDTDGPPHHWNSWLKQTRRRGNPISSIAPIISSHTLMAQPGRTLAAGSAMRSLRSAQG